MCAGAKIIKVWRFEAFTPGGSSNISCETGHVYFGRGVGG